MTDRLEVHKTMKLYIDGAFPRSESGRVSPLLNAKGDLVAHVAQASRKDLRDAVEAARRAQPGWAGTTAYNRGQVLYRMAEMMESRREELAQSIRETAQSKGSKNRHHTEVTMSIDRMVCFAGWADKYTQILGNQNPVAGGFFNFTTPEPTGVIGIITPREPSLLGAVSLLAPVICSGNAAILLASESSPLPSVLLGEIAHTSDVPAGVINILTGSREELLTHFASHRDIDGLHGAGLSSHERTLLARGVAENIKRIALHDEVDWSSPQCDSPWWIEPFVEMKTVWHG